MGHARASHALRANLWRSSSASWWACSALFQQTITQKARRPWCVAVVRRSSVQFGTVRASSSLYCVFIIRAAVGVRAGIKTIREGAALVLDIRLTMHPVTQSYFSIVELRYWYKDFFLFPHMQTIWVALDRMTPENGMCSSFVADVERHVVVLTCCVLMNTRLPQGDAPIEPDGSN